MGLLSYFEPSLFPPYISIHKTLKMPHWGKKKKTQLEVAPFMVHTGIRNKPPSDSILRRINNNLVKQRLLKSLAPYFHPAGGHQIWFKAQPLREGWVASPMNLLLKKVLLLHSQKHYNGKL